MKYHITLSYVTLVLVTIGFTADLANGKWVSKKGTHLNFLSPPDLIVKEDVKDSWAEEGENSARSAFSTTVNEAKLPKDMVKETTYVGAVLEYEPYNEWTDEEQGYGVLRKNAERIVQFATRAKTEYDVDIMVIPEYALSSLNVFSDDVERFLTFTLYVPEPTAQFVPCSVSDQKSDHLQALRMMSCAAKENEMYLVINVAELHPCSVDTVRMAPWPVAPSTDCPQEGYYFYNCEVVFDKKGTVVAKYRKQHLFMEDIFTPGEKDDKPAIFLTDFNVLFSLQTCFDIAFEHPGYNNVKYMGIKDVVMSTAWVDYLPFELADEVQSGWSTGLKTNLLVSGHHKPEKAKLGSGIFRGYSGQLPVYTYNKDSGNVLVASNVTTIKATQLVPQLLNYEEMHFQSPHPKFQSWKRPMPHSLLYPTQEKEHRHLVFHENLQNYTKVLLKQETGGKTFKVSACSNNNFCCDLTYQYSGNLTYMFLVYSGKFSIGSGTYNLGKQVCGVVWCKTSDYNTCAHPELGFPDNNSFGPFTVTSSSFKAETVFVSGSDKNLSLINNDKQLFQAKGTFATVSTGKPVPDLLVTALYGRWFCEDEF